VIHLVTGGLRAGKSRFALDEVQRLAPAGVIGFVATAEAGDDEMSDRIRRHRDERPPRFRTVEAPLDPAGALRDTEPVAFVLDCLTMWVSNLLFLPGTTDVDIHARVLTFAEAAAASSRPLVVVTNEVGLGIIPADPLTRRYANLLGRANQQVAACAAAVTLLVAGIPLRVR
jgi:adenosyl cobinamide kinase/adenosyl cobinamide phosphate guanylyltransferase